MLSVGGLYKNSGVLFLVRMPVCVFDYKKGIKYNNAAVKRHYVAIYICIAGHRFCWICRSDCWLKSYKEAYFKLRILYTTGNEPKHEVQDSGLNVRNVRSFNTC